MIALASELITNAQDFLRFPWPGVDSPTAESAPMPIGEVVRRTPSLRRMPKFTIQTAIIDRPKGGNLQSDCNIKSSSRVNSILTIGEAKLRRGRPG